jgi:hypothetical protein
MNTLAPQLAAEDTAAGLLDTLAELASLPGGYTLIPDEPVDRAVVATLAQLLDAPASVIDWETVQITGALGRARITVSLRVMGGAR